MEYPLSVEERVAATAVAALGKRSRDGPEDPSTNNKMARTQVMITVGPPRPPQQSLVKAHEPVLKPFPYFFYRDFSTQADPDPLTPLTAPGRVPNFPAKMHSILSRPDLADVVAWMPHGRSWRVLKPREFEIRVIPTYFEHAKFSSFIRQANGWGFRRITQGRDRNSYYHEMFLRGLPHLCKMMKRPGVSEKQAADPEHEPDFYKISEENPVPEKADDESILLQCTLQGGPKARMPIYFGAISLKSSAAPDSSSLQSVAAPQTETKVGPPFNPTPQVQVKPNDHFNLASFQQPVPVAETQVNSNVVNADTAAVQVQRSVPQPTFVSAPASPVNMSSIPQPQAAPQPAPATAPENPAAPLATTNPLAVTNPLAMMTTPPNMAAALQASSAASQFAAGFAAATALSQQQFRAILGQALAAATGAAPNGQSPQFPPPSNP